MSAMRVLIAGAGMAAIEAVLALRDLAGDRVAIELLAPTDELVYVPQAVLEPFAPGSVRRYALAEVLAEQDVSHLDDVLAAVDPQRHLVSTGGGKEVGYDLLLVCVGSRPAPAIPGALTFRPQAAAEVADVLREVEAGRVRSLAFVVPPGVAWSLPAYELALLTRGHARAQRIEALKLAVITRESAPLEVFGEAASEAVGELLAAGAVELVAGFAAERYEEGAVVSAGGERAEAERAVALPRLKGPAVSGLPADDAGFIPVDGHGKVRAADDVYAAGDATSFPVKQGGIATQQADAAAEAIAARAGADLEPRRFDPVLRGKLLAEAGTEYLRARFRDGEVESTASREPLWTPTAKVAGRHLAPRLQRLDRARRS